MRVDACDYAPLRSRGLRLILSDFVSELLNTQGLGFSHGVRYLLQHVFHGLRSTFSESHGYEYSVKVDHALFPSVGPCFQAIEAMPS